MICLPSWRYSGPMNPTTVLTSSGSNARATAYARASNVCWSTPWWASADSALPCPVSKYMQFVPTVPRPSDSAASCASRSIARVTPNPEFAASVPATDWNTRSTGAPRSMISMEVVTWASTQDWVGMS
ncbi:hypothetical protein WY02_09060 [Pseudonocardia sp. AL041005-10]|nr:hypothetical protein WY02_09060 [Pseudonocardia sp. AL041005-10]